MAVAQMTRHFDTVSEIIDNLFVAAGHAQVEDVFARHAIADPSTRTDLLRRCMKVRDISNSPQMLTEQQEYEDELSIFLDGTWRFLS